MRFRQRHSALVIAPLFLSSLVLLAAALALPGCGSDPQPAEQAAPTKDACTQLCEAETSCVSGYKMSACLPTCTTRVASATQSGCGELYETFLRCELQNFICENGVYNSLRYKQACAAQETASVECQANADGGASDANAEGD